MQLNRVIKLEMRVLLAAMRLAVYITSDTPDIANPDVIEDALDTIYSSFNEKMDALVRSSNYMDSVRNGMNPRRKQIEAIM